MLDSKYKNEEELTIGLMNSEAVFICTILVILVSHNTKAHSMIDLVAKLA